MASFIFLLYFSSLLFFVLSKEESNMYNTTVGDFAYWPNATIPFYVNPQHFDKEQSMAIMSALAVYAFRTCLQFNPVMAEPGLNQHVLSFENPGGVRKCVIGMDGHAKEEPHRIILGYDCLKTPQIDMLIMKALGFPFEHNRASRDVFIDVLLENIEVDSITLFTKEKTLPKELRELPYDVDSVMHFGERDFSKNGHRTIKFKTAKTLQNKVGLSKLDLRKINIVYGPECLKRERQAKIDICRNYPVVRKRRDIDLATVGSLRVNSDITPPPDVLDVPVQRNLTEEVMNNLKELGIENEVQELIDQIHKITATTLENAKLKYCNLTKDRADDRRNLDDNEQLPDLNEIINTVDKYMNSVVHNAVLNLSIFCDGSNSTEMFQRIRCGWGTNNQCPIRYKSTKPGLPKYSTQHRPIIGQSTKHDSRGKKRQYINILRSKKNTEVASNLTRRKRDIEAIKVEIVTKVVEGTTEVSPAVVIDNLRMPTKLLNVKKVNLAPLRKHFRESVSRNEYNEDGSREPQEKRKKQRLKSRLRRPEQEVMKIEIASNKDDQSSEKKLTEYTENKELEERKKYKMKTVRKERIRFRTPKTVRLSKENKDYYRERIWPDGVVKYIIEENTKYDTNQVRTELAEVSKILRRRTCVSLEEILEETDSDTDYLVIDTSRDYVTGRVGGKQNFGSLELFEGGQHRQHAAMMVMAMLGFYFEVSRHDRDKYIRIHNRHIRPDKLHHFEKIRPEATLPLPYDYASATHPAWQFWRKLGKTGISSVATYKDQDPNGFIMKTLGQNAQLLSDTDIIKINSIYGIKCFKNQRRMKIRYTKSVT